VIFSKIFSDHCLHNQKIVPSFKPSFLFCHKFCVPRKVSTFPGRTIKQIYCKGSNLSYTDVLLNSLGEGYLSMRSSLSSPSSPHLACPCHACPHPACPHRASPHHANPRRPHHASPRRPRHASPHRPRHASPRRPRLPILPPRRGCGCRVGVVVAVVTWHSSLCLLSPGPWLPTPRGHGRHVIAVVVGSLVVALSSPPLVSGWRRRGRGGGGWAWATRAMQGRQRRCGDVVAGEQVWPRCA
jgi:hypothetical protein